MNIDFFKKPNKPKHKKDGRINPHHFMIWFMSVFLFVVIFEILAFTYFFIVSSRKLDAPVEPKLDTNATQLKRLEKSIQKIEDAVAERTGGPSASQNEPSIVQ